MSSSIGVSGAGGTGGAGGAGGAGAAAGTASTSSFSSFTAPFISSSASVVPGREETSAGAGRPSLPPSFPPSLLPSLPTDPSCTGTTAATSNATGRLPPPLPPSLPGPIPTMASYTGQTTAISTSIIGALPSLGCSESDFQYPKIRRGCTEKIRSRTYKSKT